MPEQVEDTEYTEAELEAQDGSEEESASTETELSDDDKDNIIKKLRQENASRRIKSRDEQRELEEFRAWKESQMTELEKLQARLAETEKRALEAERKSIISEFGLDDDLAVLVKGSEEEMRDIAELLAKKSAKKPGSSFSVSDRAPAKPKQDDGAAFLNFLAENGRFSL